MVILSNSVELTSQASPFNLLESIQANLGVNWASQNIAGACRSLRFQHYANGQCTYGDAFYLRDRYGC